MNITKSKFVEAVNGSVSKSEVCRKLNMPSNGTGLRKVAKLAQEYSVDISHFSHQAAVTKFNRKYELIEKSCPVCGTHFQTRKGHKREKVTCSHSCSNSYFAEKRNKPESWKSYRTICFKKWEKKCLICGYDRVVQVHHLNGNHNDNSIDNLIPLCANHHEEMHSPLYFDELKQILINKYQLIPTPKFKGAILNLKSNKKHNWPDIDEIISVGVNVVATQLSVPVSYVKKHLKNAGVEIAE